MKRGVFKIRDDDPNYVEFADFLIQRGSEFKFEADAWIYWYLNLNIDVSRDSVDISAGYPSGVVPIEGCLIPESDPHHYRYELVRELIGSKDENETRYEFFRSNLSCRDQVFLIEE